MEDAFNYFDGTSAGKPGQIIEISGFGFTGATAVSFGSHAASSFSVIGDSEILATLPRNFTTGSTGATVHVTNPAGTENGPDVYLVQAPSVSSISPTSGAAGDTVTITGTGFEGTTDVEFGPDGTSTPADFTVDSETQITATVPNGATSGPIAVTNQVDTAVSGTFTVTG